MTALITAAALGTPYFWRATVPLRYAIAVQRGRTAAKDPTTFRTRLTSAPANAAAAVADVLPSSDRSVIALQLKALASSAARDDAARALGLASYLLADFAAAAKHFESIGNRNAGDWNDLAAAQSAAAHEHRDEERWLTALTAADRAIALDPTLIEPFYNRATIVERLGATAVADRLWQDYLRRDRSSAWAAAARHRLASHGPAQADIWRTIVSGSEAVTVGELARLAAQHPEQARKYAEGWFPAQWADATASGDRDAAQRNLGFADLLAETLRNERGESLARESVSVIKAADAQQTQRLVTAYQAYRTARKAHVAARLSEAEREFRRARAAFMDAGSPMAAVAEFFLACIAFDQDRPLDALTQLHTLLARERAVASNRHRALIAHIQYQIALCEASRGHWSDSLAAVQQAIHTFRVLGEPGNGGTAEAMLSECYDFLGQPELAWRHAIVALHANSAAGDVRRARTIVSGLCRTEMRGRRWQRARALSLLEAEFARIAPDPRFEADLFVRMSIIYSNLHLTVEAQEAVKRARTAAQHVQDLSSRTKLFADIDSAAGVIARPADPSEAVRLLTSAIDFQRRATRPILLSELYLERGRAYRSLGDFAAAERDFTDGISELERQRSRLNETQLRTGIFDDAFELFAEAVSVQLQRNATPRIVLATIERGRARTLLEQLGESGWQSRESEVGVGDIQRQLGPDTALIEFFALPEQLITIVVRNDRISMKTQRVSRTALAAETASLIAELSEKGGRHSATVLFDILMRPVAADLRGVTALNIVGDDVLQRVPFAALFDSYSRSFLVEHFAIGTAPSAAVFAVTSKRHTLDDRAPFSAVIFGNPTVPRDEFPSLPSLAGAQHEARWVAARYPRSEVFTGDDATAERFLSTAVAFEIVHFAGHAILVRAEPGSSALIFASSTSRHGAVTSRDIMRMRFDSMRLVVLAACSTMAGRNAAIEGVQSIGRAFLVAGVPAVIGTLWDVNDGDAAPLMRAVHEQVARGVPPDQALRRAQIDTIRRGKNPGEWAAFALTGAARPVSISESLTLEAVRRTSRD